uniref:Uncharacterized protein n=1 Tax=Acrobeloides nanus TaxID=290746 RepID=A0A914D5A1_9BILA
MILLSINGCCDGAIYADFWRNADIQSCFAKIRTVAGVNSEIRKPIDRVANTARLDLLYDTFMEFIEGICSKNETIACEDLFEMYNPAFEIANETIHSLTAGEKKELDKWVQDGNYDAEKKFFLELYNDLSISEQQKLRQAFTDIFNLFSGSSLKGYMNNFLQGLNYDDQNKLKKLGEEDDQSGIKKIVSSKAKNNDLSDHEVKDLEKFLFWAFSGSGKAR